MVANGDARALGVPAFSSTYPYQHGVYWKDIGFITTSRDTPIFTRVNLQSFLSKRRASAADPKGPAGMAWGCTCPIRTISDSTVSFHNFKSQNFKLSISNPKSKYVAYLSVPSQISNCQGLGRNKIFEILKTGRNNNFNNLHFRTSLEANKQTNKQTDYMCNHSVFRPGLLVIVLRHVIYLSLSLSLYLSLSTYIYIYTHIHSI